MDFLDFKERGIFALSNKEIINSKIETYMKIYIVQGTNNQEKLNDLHTFIEDRLDKKYDFIRYFDYTYGDLASTNEVNLLLDDYKAQDFDVIVINNTRINEPETLKDYLVSHKIDPSDIIVVNHPWQLKDLDI